MANGIDASDVLMLIHELEAVREQTNLNISAMLERLNRMLPHDVPVLCVPAGKNARKRFYKQYLSES